jgi:hypothetical protein
MVELVFVHVLIDIRFSHRGGARAGEISGGWVGSPMWLKIFMMDAASVTNAIRRVVNLKLKGPCTFWYKENADPIHLLCVY